MAGTGEGQWAEAGPEGTDDDGDGDDGAEGGYDDDDDNMVEAGGEGRWSNCQCLQATKITGEELPQ